MNAEVRNAHTKIGDKPIAHAGADSSPRCAVSHGSVTYALFKHMADEHGLTLLESELTEIVRLVNDNMPLIQKRIAA